MPGEPLPKRDQALRQQTREFLGEFASTIQKAADDVARTTDDRRIKEATIRWKIGAIRSIRQATLRTSPNLALIDSWALCCQMTNFLSNDAGSSLFETGRGILLTNAQASEARVAAAARAHVAAKDRKAIESFLTDYVRDFPLRNLEFDREPVAARWEASRGELPSTPIGTGSEAMADLSDRVQILSELVPAEMRWRLSLEAGLWQDTLVETRETLREIDAAMKSISTTIAATPATLSNAVVELRALAPTLTRLEKQWSLTLGAVDTQRAALAKDIAAERAATLRELDQQRAALMKDVRATAADVTERSLREARGVLREVMIFGVILAVVLLGMPFYFGYLVGRRKAH